MFFLSTLIFILFNYFVFAEKAPRLYAGGCGIYADILYYAGGITDTDSINENFDFNRNIYSLNLEDGFNLDDNDSAVWNITSKAEGPISDFSNVVVNEKMASLFVVGGKNRPKKESFKKYNILKNKWELYQTAVDTFPSPDKMVDGKEMKYSYYLSSLTQASFSNNFYFHYGGVTLYPNMTRVDGRKDLSIINGADGKWKKLNDGPDYVSDHAAAVYENRLYIVGGNNPYTAKPRPMSQIFVYDYPSNAWSTVTAKGDIPESRFGHSSILLKSKMIIAGGSLTSKFDSFPSPSIYVLELKNPKELIYKEYQVSNFFNAYLGCLTYYNDHLIYSFGFHTGNILSKTQIIDIKDDHWKVVRSLPAKLKDTGSKSSSLPTVIGGSIGGVLGLLTIITLIWFILKQKSKSRNRNSLSGDSSSLGNLNPPNLLQGNVWIPATPGELKEANFTLNTDTMLPGFDDDITSPGEQTRGTNTKTT
ncbi:galactose oxidase [Neoconidiobolus thromboides FSU 785]|nr:galactose oxidase [Neoconidiobolus thromboides FSU 785]